MSGTNKCWPTTRVLSLDKQRSLVRLVPLHIRPSIVTEEYWANTLIAGLAAGVTEAVAVVTPMEVVKIRLQAQHHSMADPLDIPKYRNAAHALYTVVKEEGFGALYRGVSLTALRQGSNQAVNFTAYSEFRARLQAYHGTTDLASYETMLIGLVSGAMGPLSNAPIDTIKTRLQKTPAEPGQTAVQRIVNISK